MLQDIVFRIDQRLEALNLTAAEASREAEGVSEDAIRNIRRAAKGGPHKGASIITLAAIAPVLGVSLGWLVTGESHDPRDPQSRWAIWASATDAERAEAEDYIKTRRKWTGAAA